MDPETITNIRDELMRRAEARGFCFQDAGAPPMQHEAPGDREFGDR